jgi:hypothetical protein
LVQILVVVLVVAVFGLLAWWSAARERKRLAALAAWCAREGFDFDSAKLASPGHDYDLFRRGHSRYQRYTARKDLAAAVPGLDSAGLRLFEYHYAVTRSSGKHTRTDHYFQSCALADPGVDLGTVALRREGWGDKLVQALGFDDIDLEDPEFSGRYVVGARERKDAYDLLDGAMMRFLCAHEVRFLETRGRGLLVHLEGRASPEAFRWLAGFVLGFLAQLPRPLVNAERARRGLAPLVEAGNASTASREALDRTKGQPLA